MNSLLNDDQHCRSQDDERYPSSGQSLPLCNRIGRALLGSIETDPPLCLGTASVCSPVLFWTRARGIPPP